MKETLTLKKVQLSIVAIAMAAIVALGMSAFATQAAYAEDALPYGDTATKTIKGVKYTFININSTPGVGVKAVKADKSVKSITVPATVKINGQTYKVTQIRKGAFKNTSATKVVLSKNVKSLKAGAFKGSKVKTVVTKSKLFKKANTKNCFKNSKVTTLKVKIGSASVNKKYVKTYKKVFTKANAGKKVTVKK